MAEKEKKDEQQTEKPLDKMTVVIKRSAQPIVSKEEK